MKEENITAIEALMQELVDNPKVNTEDVLMQAKELKDKYNQTKHTVLSKKETLTQYIIYIEEYYIIIEEITVWIVAAKQSPALYEAISTDAKAVKRQLKSLEVRTGYWPIKRCNFATAKRK